MTLAQQLRTMADTTYFDYIEGMQDGIRETYNIELLPGLDQTELNLLRQDLPEGTMNEELEQLLRYTRGFNAGYRTEEIRFDEIAPFGYEELLGICQIITHDSAH